MNILQRLQKAGLVVAGGIISSLIIIVSVFVGVYYHNEIRVVLQAIGVTLPADNTDTLPQPSTTPSVETQSFLNIATLNEPLPLVESDTLEEAQLQEYLKQGAVILPLGTVIGQPGNVVITAHSSGTSAFGPYRFAFARLSELEEGQEFTITTPDANYTYKVYGKEIVWPHEVDKLPKDDRSTITLVTCWPLWTNFKRLLVHSELVGTYPL